MLKELPHCSQMARLKKRTEKKRTLRLASSSSEEEVDEVVGESSFQAEEEIPTESSTKEHQSESDVNLVAESGQLEEVEEGKVTRSEKI